MVARFLEVVRKYHLNSPEHVSHYPMHCCLGVTSRINGMTLINSQSSKCRLESSKVSFSERIEVVRIGTIFFKSLLTNSASDDLGIGDPSVGNESP